MNTSYLFRISLACILGTPILAQAGMFKCTNAQGKMAYQDAPCSSSQGTQQALESPSSPSEKDPVLAAVMLGSTAYLLERMEKFCSTKVPESKAVIGKARMEWHERHEQLFSKGSQILQARLSYEERTKLYVQSRRDNDAIIATLESSASEDSIRNSCMDFPAKMLHPKINLIKHPVLVKTITDYKPL